MKAVFVALALAVSTLAQGVSITQPPAGSTEKQGLPMTVVVQKQNSLTGSQDVAVAIGLQSCGTASCDSLPTESVGPLLFSGEYAPKADASGNVTQNYIVRVPAGMGPGPARLSVAHFYILGASEMAPMDVAHTTLNITA
ncbi:hypothetical protein VTO73DRAFT_9636 [Trametes versicolor]